MKLGFAMGVAALAFACSPSTFAKSKPIQRYKAVVEGQSFKVIRYANGSVKVVDGGVFGPGYGYKLRDRMRQAARQATGCDIADDFDQDGKLIGTLVCASAGTADVGQ